MLEEVLLTGERSRELDDDVSGRGVSGHVARVSGSTKTCEHLVHKSSGFLSTRLEADAARETLVSMPMHTRYIEITIFP